VCRLKKELYGLKQTPRAWYGIIDSFFTNLGFTKSNANPNDSDLCMNTMKYINTHKCRYAAEVKLHFINNK
jgi:hypothetical protein